MVQSYLSSARERYDRERDKVINSSAPDDDSRRRTGAPPPEEEVRCINTGCDGLAGAATSYLCSSCFERQRQDELNMRNSCCSAVETVDSARLSDVGGGGGIPRVDSGPRLPCQVQSPKYAGGSRGTVVINVAPFVAGPRPLDVEPGGGVGKQRATFQMDINGGSSLLNAATSTMVGGASQEALSRMARSGVIYQTGNDTAGVPGKRSVTSSSSSTPNGTATGFPVTGFPYGESSVRIPVTQHGYESGRMPIGTGQLSSYAGTKYVQSVAVTRPYSPETLTLYRDNSALHPARCPPQCSTLSAVGDYCRSGASPPVRVVTSVLSGSGANWDGKSFEKQLESSLCELRDTIAVNKSTGGNGSGSSNVHLSRYD